MGVKGLWLLLSPAGWQIKLESLEGKTLAIDASIWVISLIYAAKYNLENEEISSNSHI